MVIVFDYYIPISYITLFSRCYLLSLLLLFVFTSIWGVSVFCFSPYQVNYKVVLAISYLSTLLVAVFRHSASLYFVYTLAFILFITTFSFMWVKLQLIENNPTLPSYINSLFNNCKKYLYKYWYLSILFDIVVFTFTFYTFDYALDFDTFGFILLAIATFAVHTVYTVPMSKVVTDDGVNNRKNETQND